jgi:glucose-1-phosphate adenylyltransferase
VQAHEDSGARITLAVTPVPAERRSRYGMVALDDQDRIRRFDEKPAESDLRWASMGLYVFEAGFLLRALDALPGPDLVYDLIQPALASGERIHGFRYQGYWEDVGELETYYRANLELLDERPALRLDDPRWTILTRNEERPPARFGDRAKVDNSLIAGGARVDGTVARSIVFSGAWIEEGAQVEDAIVFHDGWIGKGARVARAILDKDVIVSEESRVGEPGVPGDGAGLAVVGKEAVVAGGEVVKPGRSVPPGGGRVRGRAAVEAVAHARGEWPR